MNTKTLNLSKNFSWIDNVVDKTTNKKYWSEQIYISLALFEKHLVNIMTQTSDKQKRIIARSAAGTIRPAFESIIQDYLFVYFPDECGGSSNTIEGIIRKWWNYVFHSSRYVGNPTDWNKVNFYKDFYLDMENAWKISCNFEHGHDEDGLFKQDPVTNIFYLAMCIQQILFFISKYAFDYKDDKPIFDTKTYISTVNRNEYLSLPIKGDVKPIFNFISVLINNDNKFYIPYYQRIYKWNAAQVRNFLYDLIDLTEKTLNINDNELDLFQHYFGVLATKNEQDQINIDDAVKTVNYCKIIDGQQRIITTLIFLCAIRDILLSRCESSTTGVDLIDHFFTKQNREYLLLKDVFYRISNNDENILYLSQIFDGNFIREPEFNKINFIKNKIESLSINDKNFLLNGYLNAYVLIRNGLTEHASKKGIFKDNIIRILTVFSKCFSIVNVKFENKLDGLDEISVFNNINNKISRLPFLIKFKNLLFSKLTNEVLINKEIMESLNIRFESTFGLKKLWNFWRIQLLMMIFIIRFLFTFFMRSFNTFTYLKKWNYHQLIYLPTMN